jgi:hypothetical protein
MRRYLIKTKGRSDEVIYATSFDTNALIEIEGRKYVPFFYDKEIVGLSLSDGITGIMVTNWDVDVKN